MAVKQFQLIETNPNRGTRGCLCNPMGVKNQEGPFATFPSEMHYVHTPIAVVCAKCIRRLNESLEDYEEKHAPEV